ncbi:MAG TPA: 7-carboxy-7-deazaguanine synthase, partial [Spirochaetota bacterium]
EEKSFCLENIVHLTSDDELKFVVATENDLDFTAEFIRNHLGENRSVINISPADRMMTPARCASFILNEGINARINLQLHKIIWPDGEEK